MISIFKEMTWQCVSGLYGGKVILMFPIEEMYDHYVVAKRMFLMYVAENKEDSSILTIYERNNTKKGYVKFKMPSKTYPIKYEDMYMDMEVF